MLYFVCSICVPKSHLSHNCKNCLLNHGTMRIFFKTTEFIPIGWWIILFFTFKVKMTKMPFLPIFDQVDRQSNQVNFFPKWEFSSFHVKINVFFNHCLKFWPRLTMVNPHSDLVFLSKKKGLTIWVRKFMVHVIDNLTLFNLTVHGPKSNLKWARYSGEKKKKIASWFKVTMCHYSSNYWIISKQPQSCPNKMSLERACDDFHFGELNLLKFHLIKVNLPKI